MEWIDFADWSSLFRADGHVHRQWDLKDEMKDIFFLPALLKANDCCLKDSDVQEYQQQSLI